jgi:hypothetical protein
LRIPALTLRAWPEICMRGDDRTSHFAGFVTLFTQFARRGLFSAVMIGRLMRKSDVLPT